MYEELKQQIKEHEGFVPKIYKCPLGKRTIGYGHLILDHEQFEEDKEYTKEQLELVFEKDFEMSLNDANPMFVKIINFIRSNNLSDDENTYIIQLGSSSGRDLEFFLKIFPKLNYISTDVKDEILDFQREKYSYSNLKYFKCYAEDIDECINHFKVSDKNIILFSSGSLQYVNPFFLEEFFSILRNYKILNLFISEPVSLLFIDNNNLQSLTTVDETLNMESYREKFEAFGCNVINLDGHNHNELEAAFSNNNLTSKPLAVIAKTTKGKGVSFMENQVKWHYKSPNTEELSTAIKEIDNA